MHDNNYADFCDFMRRLDDSSPLDILEQFERPHAPEYRDNAQLLRSPRFFANRRTLRYRVVKN